MSELQNVVRVTLSSKKTVILREFKIKHFELALKAVGNRAKGNDTLAAYMQQNELLKILLVEVDGNPTKGIEDLDKIFTAAEYMQMQKVMQKITVPAEVDDEGNEPVIETVSSFGAK